MNAPAKPLAMFAASGGLLRRNTIIVLILLLAAFVVGIELARPGTVNATWLSNALLFAAPLGILAAGQTLVMLTGGIDLSVAAIATGSAYILATSASLGGVTAVLLGLALGLVVGFINGVGIAILGVQPLVMTLGTGLMTGGVLTVYSQQMLASEPRVPDFIQALGSGKLFGIVPFDLVLLGYQDRLPDDFRGSPVPATAASSMRSATTRGACRGVRVWQVLLVDYVLCGLFAAIAGLVLVGGTNAADLSLADVYLLPSVAAVIIGGTSIFGGRGGYAGSIVGALILTVLTSLLTLLDTSEPLKQILYGAIILALAAAYARLTD